MKLTHTRIVTNDVAGLMQFYRAVTGICPVDYGDYVEFRTGGGTLAICSQQTMDLHGAAATIPASNGSVVLDFQVTDVDEERARLQAIAWDIVLEPTDQPWGTRSMMFRDPDGNLINYFTPIVKIDTGTLEIA